MMEPGATTSRFWLVFSYGSNGVAQLRARCKNEALVARPAFARGFSRVFCLRAEGWRGGVASICPCENAVTYGSLVSLTESEKKRLDAFEGGYRDEAVDVWEVVGDATVKRRATAYVAGSSRSSFTPTMVEAPSEAYRVACHLHLRSHFPTKADVEIRSAADPSLLLTRWTHPGVDALETLEALAVEVNALKETPSWTMPSAANKFAEDLKQVGITTVADVANVLSPAEESSPPNVVSGWTGPVLRELKERDPDFWDDDALRALRKLPLQRVFVYGTLRDGMSNHHRLYSSSGDDDTRLVFREARTEDTDLALVQAPGGGAWPYAVRGDDARRDSTRGPLVGEVYAVSTDLLETSLDELEGHPFFYARSRLPIVAVGTADDDKDGSSSSGKKADDGRQQTTTTTLAWVYFLIEEQALQDMRLHPAKYPDVVPTGDFKAFRHSLLRN
mmetsp:Transcript_32222/g.102733  ORF Transcript_32222/g.102733 Transcript_32222/m.102733 type:complete len:446 (+) Transcript_32222:19-1356(+)